MSYEKDEIKLRETLFYEQAFFYKEGALQSLNISGVKWVEESLENILKLAAEETKTDRGSIFKSKQCCLNIKYKL